MKEKVQEFDIDIRFHFDSSMTIEATSEAEALKIAQRHYLEVVKDHLKDRGNLNIRVKSRHTITPEERVRLEQDGIIEPVKKTLKPQAYIGKLPEFVPAKNQGGESIEDLRRRRDNLSVKIYTWKKQGKDVSELEEEMKELKEQIKNAKK